MNCPDCRSTDTEHIIRSADEMFVPSEMRPGGLFAWVKRCWECGKNESGYTTLAFRPVTIDDAQLLFDWRTDPETVANSYSDGPSSFEAHAAWMTHMLRPLQQPGPSFLNQLAIQWLIGCIGTEPVGVIRVHLFSYPPELHTTVAPQWRGRGIGTAMLALAPVHAKTIGRVKGTNGASLISFEKAGWTLGEVVYVK